MSDAPTWTCSECGTKMKADSEIVIDHWRREHLDEMMNMLTIEGVSY